MSDLPNLIPALAYPKEIYFPTPMIAVDTEGSLRLRGAQYPKGQSHVELSEGLTYTVISEVPYRDRTLLGKTSTKYPQTIEKYYLQVPPEIAHKLRQHTEEIRGLLTNTRSPELLIYQACSAFNISSE